MTQTQITITLDADRVRQLESDAERLGVTIEEVARQGIEEYLARKQAVREAARQVLRENAELYRRLAQ